jgi:RNA polymerase sigma-70 factor, ECF subfamily
MTGTRRPGCCTTTLDGPEVALAAVDRLEHRLAGYHAYHATRADLLRRLGRSEKSRCE